MNPLEDDIRTVLRSQADAMQVPEPHPEGATGQLIRFEPTPTRHEDRNGWPIIAMAAAAAVVGIAVGGLVIATREEDPTREVAASQPATVAQPPVAFTACVRGGDDEGALDPPSTVEQIHLPDGETTIERRSQPFEVNATDVSDPRLDGTWLATPINDIYSGPGSDGLVIGTWTQRIENADGAWQGSHQTIDFPDGQTVGGFGGLYVMIGDGAYEGLTAFMTVTEEDLDEGVVPDCPNIRGYIIPTA